MWRWGKTIVRCKDSPGFIANRLGIYWMQLGADRGDRPGADGRGSRRRQSGARSVFPKTGVFGLMDLVGIDLGPHINASLRGVLPKSDAFHSVDRDVPLIGRMIEQGLTGRKGKGGFYRLDRSGGGRTMLAMDLNTGQYRPEQKPILPEIEAAGQDLAGSAVGARQDRHLCVPRAGADHRLCGDAGARGGRLDRRHR